MSNYWKSKVVPKFKKLFDKGKKKGASEVCKSFDKSKESLDKEIGEKSADLNPKIVEIYRSSSAFITKKLLKEPKEVTVKENPDAAQGVLQELVKAGFPGAQVICDAGAKFGPAPLSGPIVYLFEKASVYLVEEPLPEERKEESREVSVEDVKAETAAPEGTIAEGEEAAAPVVEQKKQEEAAKEEEPAATAPPPPAAIVEAAEASETPVPAVVDALADTGVAIPAHDDSPAPPAPASAEPAPPPPPAADKTD